MRVTLAALTVALAAPAWAEPFDVLQTALAAHIEPGFAAFATASAEMAQATEASCDPADPAVGASFNAAWDAWISVSHLRFGPTEVDNRAFALGFWPDARAMVPKTLKKLISEENPVVADPVAFHEVSIAGRGFTALEYLLFDPSFNEKPAYECQLRQAIAQDIARISADISAEWSGMYGAAFLTFDATSPYRTEMEALKVLFSSALVGLEFSKDTRIGRPLGTFDKPRPNLAEARRAGRSVRHVLLSTEAVRDLSLILAMEDAEVQANTAAEFDRAIANIEKIKDPTFGDLDSSSAWLRADIAAQGLDLAMTRVRDEVGAIYDLSAGFSSLDGD